LGSKQFTNISTFLQGTKVLCTILATKYILFSGQFIHSYCKIITLIRNYLKPLILTDSDRNRLFYILTEVSEYFFVKGKRNFTRNTWIIESDTFKKDLSQTKALLKFLKSFVKKLRLFMWRRSRCKRGSPDLPEFAASRPQNLYMCRSRALRS
jgi:hypothetical protein